MMNKYKEVTFLIPIPYQHCLRTSWYKLKINFLVPIPGSCTNMHSLERWCKVEYKIQKINQKYISLQSYSSTPDSIFQQLARIYKSSSQWSSSTTNKVATLQIVNQFKWLLLVLIVETKIKNPQSSGFNFRRKNGVTTDDNKDHNFAYSNHSLVVAGAVLLLNSCSRRILQPLVSSASSNKSHVFNWCFSSF